MKAVIYETFQHPPKIEQLPDPAPDDHGVVVRVEATGLCRSDWHGWMGHDPDIQLPHVPGHELAGVIEAAGKRVERWQPGDRVTVPFVGGCGACPDCRAGDHQVCDHQFQPGFTHWGSFAERVSIHYADTNLVRLPGGMEYATAAGLGCRFATSFRAVVDQGEVKAGQWVAVHGCGGVGLSAVMIARASGARVISVDIAHQKLDLARELGAEVTVNAAETPQVAEAIEQYTGGGAHVSLDALGSNETCFNSISCLKNRGRHIQVGLMVAGHSRPDIPMGKVIDKELEVLGSHGMQAHRYHVMLDMVQSGRLAPEKLITRTISLDEAAGELTQIDTVDRGGVTVITGF